MLMDDRPTIKRITLEAQMQDLTFEILLPSDCVDVIEVTLQDKMLPSRAHWYNLKLSG
jgi:hypothetical protein